MMQPVNIDVFLKIVFVLLLQVYGHWTVCSGSQHEPAAWWVTEMTSRVINEQNQLQMLVYWWGPLVMERLALSCGLNLRVSWVCVNILSWFHTHDFTHISLKSRDRSWIPYLLSGSDTSDHMRRAWRLLFVCFLYLLLKRAEIGLSWWGWAVR